MLEKILDNPYVLPIIALLIGWFVPQPKIEKAKQLIKTLMGFIPMINRKPK